jgi:hypothetical protein
MLPPIPTGAPWPAIDLNQLARGAVKRDAEISGKLDGTLKLGPCGEKDSTGTTGGIGFT